MKTPVMGAPPYQVSIEDRLRWAQIADAMAHANHYGVLKVNIEHVTYTSAIKMFFNNRRSGCNLRSPNQ